MAALLQCLVALPILASSSVPGANLPFEDIPDFDFIDQYQPAPAQTAEQAAALANLTTGAASRSAAAKPKLKEYLKNTVLPALTGTPLENLTEDELLERLDWEFARLQIFHTGDAVPGDPADEDKVDTSQFTNYNNGYIVNPCQLYVFGGVDNSKRPDSPPPYYLQVEVMQMWFGLKPFERGTVFPTLAEANNCILYNANNLQKTSLGNTYYGSVTYVFKANPQTMFVFPYDSGWAWTQDPKWPWDIGTFDEFYSVLLNNVEHYVTSSSTGPKGWNLAELFKRWYVDGVAPFDLGGRNDADGSVISMPYFETNPQGNMQLPDDLIYTNMLFRDVVSTSEEAGVSKYSHSYSLESLQDPGTVKAEGLFGKPQGRALQRWLIHLKRPLMWSQSPDSGSVIDPIVNNLNLDMSESDLDYFESAWNDPGMTFEDFYSNAPAKLKFQATKWNYETKATCQDVEENLPEAIVVGINEEGTCIYVPPEPQGLELGYGCRNDGTCVQFPLPRGHYVDEQTCLENCGLGRWALVSNVDVTKNNPDREVANFCAPNQAGTYFENSDDCYKAAFPSTSPTDSALYCRFDLALMKKNKPVSKEWMLRNCKSLEDWGGSQLWETWEQLPKLPKSHPLGLILFVSLPASFIVLWRSWRRHQPLSQEQELQDMEGQLLYATGNE